MDVLWGGGAFKRGSFAFIYTLKSHYSRNTLTQVGILSAGAVLMV